MSDKVKLPKNVTEAIEKCREGYSEKDVIAIAIADYKSGSYREMQVFANEYFEVFLKAIVNGYEEEREIMSNKVKLPREVAEALDHHKYQGLHNVMEQMINMHFYETTTTQLSTIRDYFKVDWTMLAGAIVNGYEIEESPEDQVRECFKNPPLFNNGIGELSTSYRNGIRDTLDTLNIKIDGVNT